VKRAQVEVDEVVVGSINAGLLAFVAVCEGDEDKDLDWIARKITSLRMFPDDEGRMNRSVVDIKGEALLVSQFTLAADVGKGTRPSFGKAMPPARARELFADLVDRVTADVPVKTGTFQAHMDVSLVNDGPVTLWLDSRSRG
jgi:D-tyrosyl-tRNA(Tyr) deacylase